MDSPSRHETHELLSIQHKMAGVRLEKKEPKQPGALRRWRSRWQFMLFLVSVACAFVLLFTTGLLLWAVARNKVKDKQGILFEGDCDYVRKLNTGLHLLINVFSTVLLGASNYGMQCLCAPTRNDINSAHQRGGWLNIGVSSIRNLGYVSHRRLLLWICLLVSSVPLHLLYNSTVFYTTSAYGYDIYVGYDSPEGKSFASLDVPGPNSTFARLWRGAQNQSLEHLSASECYAAYATTYQAKYGGLILLSDDVNTTTLYEWVQDEEVSSESPHRWLCPSDGPCTEDTAKNNWKFLDYNVNSCLCERVPQHCKLQYSLPLTIAVIVANLVKAIVLCYMSFGTGDAPLLTTGDAVASFLDRPDRCSVGRCLLATRDVRDSYYGIKPYGYKPLNYECDRKRWISASQWRDWLSVILFWYITIITCTGLVIYCAVHDGKEIWTAKFGTASTANSSTLITSDSWPTSLIANTIIANVPQLVFSLGYFITNSLLSSMTLAAEWSRYALVRRGLRVSWNPQGAQRQSYFLSLPYRYAIPLMASSATLHWLISQSLFLVGVDAYGSGWARDPDLDVMTCGYNPIAVISAISVGAVMLACIMALSLRRLDSGMVVAGSCSLAIAAACHPRYVPNPQSEAQQSDSETAEDMQYLPVKWGSVAVDGEVGHCTFTSAEVDMPEPGRLYQ